MPTPLTAAFVGLPDPRSDRGQKHRLRRFLAGGLPRNYTLCLSRKENNEARCREALAAGGTVSVVFASPRLARFWGHRVVDGDAHDLRFLDVPGSVVGLSAKGKALRDTTGFVVRTPEDSARGPGPRGRTDRPAGRPTPPGPRRAARPARRATA